MKSQIQNFSINSNVSTFQNQYNIKKDIIFCMRRISRWIKIKRYYRLRLSYLQHARFLFVNHWIENAGAKFWQSFTGPIGIEIISFEQHKRGIAQDDIEIISNTVHQYSRYPIYSPWRWLKEIETISFEDLKNLFHGQDFKARNVYKAKVIASPEKQLLTVPYFAFIYKIFSLLDQAVQGAIATAVKRTHRLRCRDQLQLHELGICRQLFVY